MPTPSCDALVIGAGPNGLAAAFRLKTAKRSVTVVERAASVGGGAAALHPFHPDCPPVPLAHLAGQIDPRVAAGMDLARHGLSFLTADLATTVLDGDGRHLRLDGPAGATLSGPIDEADRAAWTALRARLVAFAELLAPFKAMAPPRLARNGGNDWRGLARIAWSARALGRAELRELLRLALTNVYDALDDEIADPKLKGVMAFDATLGTFLGPRSPNTLLLLLNRLSGETAGRRAALGLPKGGMASVAAAMAAAAAERGVVVRTGTGVAAILVENDRVAGVRLSTGEEIRAPLVVSAVSPKTTLLSLVGPRHLDAGLVTRMRHQKARGAAAKLTVLLSGLPDFHGADLRTRLVIAPSADAVERAFNPVKYGEVPDEPVMEILIPSAFEAGHAPLGRHLLTAVVQYAPHAPKAGPDAARAALLKACLNRLEAYAPGFGRLVVHADLLMPADIEALTGMPGGNWHHGELSVEQMLFLRPLPELARYGTPVDGLWLASAGCHPGGGISGAAGWNAADAIERAGR